MRRLCVKKDGSILTLHGLPAKETFALGEEYPKSDLAQTLFAEFGLMHLVAPYLPRMIHTNFPLREPVRKLIGSMYASEKKAAPEFIVPRSPSGGERIARPLQGRATVAFSSGKDSLWNLWWAQERFGKTNVSALHISGLNRVNGHKEREFALRQSEELDFPLEILHLRNGSRNKGNRVMRARDIFLSAITVPFALEFGASRIITEGFAETGPDEPFSGQKRNIQLFNRTLTELNVPVRVAWRDRPEMLVVKDLFHHRPDWMPLVCNCFAAPCYLAPLQRSWEKNAPSLRLYDSQCGSCVKCRITNLGRILYDEATMKRLRKKDAQFFLENTGEWMKENGKRFSDFIIGSFRADYARARRLYDLPPKAA